MTTVNLNDRSVSLNEARQIISTVGDVVTVILNGEPGVGKTSILTQMAIDNGDKWRRAGDVYPADKRHYLYIDCTSEEFNDRKMNVPVHATKTIETYISSAMQLSGGRPIVILLDEYLKCPRALKVVWTRLMLERTLGDVPLPEGSIVFATSNNASDGVGDKPEAHEGNRVMMLRVRKPSANEWLQWAASNSINTLVRAWVASNKRALASYLDGDQKDNPFIFNPTRTGAVSFVSPRSLTKAATVLDRRAAFTEHMLLASLSGLVGDAAAQGLAAMVSLSDRVPKTEDILRDPTGIEIMDDPIAQVLMMINGASDVQTQDDVEGFMQFVSRLSNESIQSVFFIQMVTSPRTVLLTRNNKSLTDWRMKNFELIS